MPPFALYLRSSTEHRARRIHSVCVSRLFEPVRYGVRLELWYRDGMYCPGRLRECE